MDILLGVVALAAIPAAGVAAFFMVLGARRRIELLEKRLALFEQRLTGQAAAAVSDRARTRRASGSRAHATA